MIQYPKRTKSAGIAGMDQIHIYKDPPKAIYTRKYEPVNVGDVMYMARPDSENGDPSRINEAINVVARGVNPMVEIDYTGNGGGSRTTSLVQRQATPAYKVEVVRPPLYPVESLVPLSNPRIHQNYTITTNPRRTPVSSAGYYDHNAVSSIIINDLAGNIRINPTKPAFDTVDINRDAAGLKGVGDVLAGNIRPSASYDIQAGRELTNLRDDATRKELLRMAVQAPVGFSEILILDPMTNTSVPVQSNIQNRNYISLQAALGQPIIINKADGQEIKLKDYEVKVVQTNLGNNQLVLTVRQPEVKLEREGLYYAMQTNVGLQALSGDNIRPTKEMELTRPLPLFSTQTNISQNIDPSIRMSNPDAYNLSYKAPLSSALANLSQNIGVGQTINPDLQLSMKTPTYAGQTNVSGEVMQRNLTPDQMKKLQLNMPYTAGQTNISRSEMNQGIQNQRQMELMNKAPLTSATAQFSNNKANLQQVNPEFQLANNAPLTSATANVSNSKANLQTVNPELGLEKALPYFSQTAPVQKQTGYNDELVRDSKVRELNKLSNFGSFEDRITRPGQQVVRNIPTSQLIKPKAGMV
jgi:hypothetical protein